MSRPARRELTDREQAVVKAVADFRILSGGQLQALFFWDGTLVGCRRRTQACLKRLVDDSYLHRLERRIGGERAGSASYCYSLAARGQRLTDPERRSRSGGEPGLWFVRHHLAVADVYVTLRQAEREGGLDLIEYQSEPGCWRLTPRPFGGSDWLKPDLSVVLGVGDYEWRWFVEVDLGTESSVTILRTLKRYVAHYRSGVEQAEHDVFPKVAWLTPTSTRADTLTRAIARLPADEQRLFTVGLTSNTLTILKGGEP